MDLARAYTKSKKQKEAQINQQSKKISPAMAYVTDDAGARTFLGMVGPEFEATFRREYQSNWFSPRAEVAHEND